MRMKYIAQIQAGLKRYRVLPTQKKTSRVLDGSYRSIFKGHSMNFDELREYVQGDDVKDIDWKASSRSQKILVRQYVAEKKHNIMLVFDTNRHMLAQSADGLEKRELALISGGTLGYMVNSNGDYVAATYATETSVQHFHFKNGLMNLELILDHYHNSVTMENHSTINKALDYVLHNFHRRMILVLVTDRDGVSSLSEATLKRLLVMHDVLLIQVGDAELNGKDLYDIDRGEYLPDFITRDKKLAAIAREKRDRAERESAEKLKRLGIACVTVNNLEDMDDQILVLLNKHKVEMKR